MSNTNPEAEKGGMTRRHAIYLMGGAVFTGLAGGLGLNALLRTPPREEVVASGSTPTALDTATSVPSPTTAPATATSTETPVPPTATDVPTKTPATATKPPEQPPVVNLENLKRYGVYTSRLGDKGEIIFYPLFQDQTLVAYMYTAKNGTTYFGVLKGAVSKQPGTGQFQISYNEASRVNLSAVVANGSSVGTLKNEDFPEGVNFSAAPTGGEGAQALAQAWISMAGRIRGAIYTPDSALQEIERSSGAKIPR